MLKGGFLFCDLGSSLNQVKDLKLIKAEPSYGGFSLPVLCARQSVPWLLSPNDFCTSSEMSTRLFALLVLNKQRL